MLENGVGALRPIRAVLDATLARLRPPPRTPSSRRAKTPICKLNWTAAAAGCLLTIKEMALIATARKLQMNACFFAAADVTIETPRVEAEPANLVRSVALIHQIAADSTKTPAVFFDRLLSH
ncbi:hypothetical protein J1C56_32380 [Aminobacter anthyllidis]|uniref:Uncharacterized protein n=1 Tax=Aminobacter anthyllidis TaxID=1035067 RepID=A0A9X1AIV0_9HYPH|nr:hypothetical protein [Aminobacter anthyllidis]MBT1160228.1 hypothetical protein [Aminobacter anthyllidis]